MLRRIVPNNYAPSIFDIDYHELKKQGIRSIIVDLDNTLVESTRAEATPQLIQWFDEIKKLGFQVIIVSNNNKTRVAHFATPLNIPFIHAARKPFSQAFKKALQILECAREETVVIGDQLLTDVLGGNRMGCYTILVVPVSETDGFLTKINRRIERLLLRWLKRKGIWKWD